MLNLAPKPRLKTIVAFPWLFMFSSIIDRYHDKKIYYYNDKYIKKLLK